MIHHGGCHCGAVRFEVEAPESLQVTRCNCSICSKSGFLHLIVPKDRFRLLSGEAALTTYTFNTGVAKHTFCKICGIKPFYVPRSHPEGMDVNVNCLDTRPSTITIEEFDGQNWEQHVHSIRHTREDT
jgi:hypothetical protein